MTGARWAIRFRSSATVGPLRRAADLCQQVVGKRQALQRRARLELPVEIVGHLAELNHLRHVQSIAAVAATCKHVIEVGRVGE